MHSLLILYKQHKKIKMLILNKQTGHPERFLYFLRVNEKISYSPSNRYGLIYPTWRSQLLSWTYPQAVSGCTVSSTTCTVEPLHVSIIRLPLKVVTLVHCFRKLVLEKDFISCASDCITFAAGMSKAEMQRLLVLVRIDRSLLPPSLVMPVYISVTLIYLKTEKIH